MNAPLYTTRLAVLLLVLLAAVALTWSACGDGGNETPEVSPLTDFPALGARLDVPSSARLGERVPLKLTVENVTDAPVEFGIGGREDTNFLGSYDFVVTTADGHEVWHWLGTLDALELILSHVKLEPGEQMQFEGVWPQADNKGGATDPGTYLVHGVLGIETEEGERLDLETEATELVISP